MAKQYMRFALLAGAALPVQMWQAKAPNNVIIPDDDIADTSTVDRGQTAGPVKSSAPPKNGPIGMPKTVKIILEETENMGPTGQTFGLNGVAYNIMPGIAVDVPEGLIEVLDNAVMSVPVVDPQTRRVVGHRDRQRFPYRVLKAAA